MTTDNLIRTVCGNISTVKPIYSYSSYLLTRQVLIIFTSTSNFVSFVGINASDINHSAGRYNLGEKPPFDCGFEVNTTVLVSHSFSGVEHSSKAWTHWRCKFLVHLQITCVLSFLPVSPTKKKHPSEIILKGILFYVEAEEFTLYMI